MGPASEQSTVKIVLLLLFAVTVARCDGETHTANESLMPSPATQATIFDRLPEGVTLSDQVRVDITNDKGEVVSSTIITVEERLRQLGAKYENGVLVDRGGKEIRFYTPPVRGASQGTEEDDKQREKDAKELADLQQKYTVIIL